METEVVREYDMEAAIAYALSKLTALLGELPEDANLHHDLKSLDSEILNSDEKLWNWAILRWYPENFPEGSSRASQPSVSLSVGSQLPLERGCSAPTVFARGQNGFL